MKKFIKENRKGFTLIELLVVIAILAVLATLYVPRIVKSSTDAKRTVAIANARTLASEITMYNFEHPTAQITGTLTKTDHDWLVSANDKALAGTETTLTGSGLLSGRDFPSSDYVYLVTDAKGNCYIVQGEKDKDGNANTGHVGDPIAAE